MQVVTKYDVGYTFWVARVFLRLEKVELNWEGETWHKDVVTYEPLAKRKRIVGIDIKVTSKGKTEVKYLVDDHINPSGLSSLYEESKVTEYTEQEALAIAKEYAEKKQEYFGN
jgi:hypothetical protein